MTYKRMGFPATICFFDIVTRIIEYLKFLEPKHHASKVVRPLWRDI
jgi:hypothetical protein